LRSFFLREQSKQNAQFTAKRQPDGRGWQAIVMRLPANVVLAATFSSNDISIISASGPIGRCNF
jgi:hypothetical protein